MGISGTAASYSSAEQGGMRAQRKEEGPPKRPSLEAHRLFVQSAQNVRFRPNRSTAAEADDFVSRLG